MPVQINGTTGISGVDGSNTTPAIKGGTSTGTGVFYGTNTVSLATGGTTAVTVDSSQNVGIGVTPSTWSLGKAIEINTVGNSVWATSTAYVMGNNFYYNGGYKFAGTGYATSYIQSTGAHVWNTSTASGTAGTAITFTQAMTLDSSGNLLVGATNSVARFYAVSGANNVPAGRFDIGVSGDVAQAAVYVVKFDNNSTTSQVFHKFFINGGASGCGQINANGAGAAAFGSTSDARLKENIEAIPNQLSNILALKPSEFDFKDGSGHQIGFIAQEMQQVYPDAINENDEGFLTITGWGRTEARLVKAIQELSAKLDAAEARIAALEAK